MRITGNCSWSPDELRLALGVSVVFSFATSVGREPGRAAQPKNPDIRHTAGFDRLMPNFEGDPEARRRTEAPSPRTSCSCPTAPTRRRPSMKCCASSSAPRALRPRRARPTRRPAVCALTASPPLLNQANELCEMLRPRHAGAQGKASGRDQPSGSQLVVTLNYSHRQRPRLARLPALHYEVAGVISSFAPRTNCQLSDGLDPPSVHGLREQPEGLQLINDLRAGGKAPDHRASPTPARSPRTTWSRRARALTSRSRTPTHRPARNAFSESAASPQQVKDDQQPAERSLAVASRTRNCSPPMKRVAPTVFTNQTATSTLHSHDVPLRHIDEACSEFGLSRLLGAIRPVRRR